MKFIATVFGLVLMFSISARAEDSSQVDAVIKQYLAATPHEEWKGPPVTSQPTPMHETDYSDLGRIIGISIVAAAGGGLWKKRKKQSSNLSEVKKSDRVTDSSCSSTASLRIAPGQKQTTKTVILIGTIVLTAMWLFPPWIHGTGAYRRTAGYYFLFDTVQHSSSVHSIDFGRLFAQTVALGIIVVLVAFLLRPKNLE